MWIAAIVVPLVLLAAPLWLAHLEDRVISGVRPSGTPDPALSGGLQAAPEPTEPDAAAQELTPEPVHISGASPFAAAGHPDHRAA
jgi:hypothetical protein